MHRPTLADLTFESDSLSMAEDCESLKSPDSYSISSASSSFKDFPVPSLRKASGEEIILLTELFLPAKRERMFIQKKNNDFGFLRKQRKYFSELKEFYQELQLINSEYVQDALFKTTSNFYHKKLKKIENSLKKNLDFQEIQKFQDFPDQVSPAIQMIFLENEKKTKKTKKGKNKEIIFPEIKQKVKEIDLLDLKEDKKTYMQSLFNSFSKRPVVSFEFHSKKVKGFLKLSPGPNKNPLSPVNPLKPSVPLNHFETLPRSTFLTFSSLPRKKQSFIHSFPSCHSLFTLLFSEKSSEDYKTLKSDLSKLFVIPTKIIETTPNEDLQLSSESEEVDLPPKSVLLKQASELTHCKFAYKSHLLKRSWNIEELQNFHRPKTRIFSDFRVFLYIDYGKERRLNENPNSFLQFSKKETLTLAAGRFILCEYIEKKPVLMQNLGMASRICNYYTEYKDEEYMGELGITCEVEEMKSVRILPDGANLAFFENNLFVAPIFYHPATGNDFLMVRTPDGWIGRSFSKVFTVGQIEPKMEVVVPKSKRSRDFKDKHFISVILEKLFLNDNEIENESFKETVQEMKLTNAKKLANEHKIIKNKGVWTCEKQISKDDFRKMISPEEFVCYETLLSGIQELADLGITLKTTEKLLSSLQTLFKEMPDQQIRFVSGYIEEKVALSPWNLTSSYSKGKKKCNFSLIGRGDPTCGHCGYSFELLSKYSSSDLSLIKDQIRKTVLKEINLLGNSWYKHLDSSEDENEDQGINFNNFNLPKDSELLFDDSAENEQEQLKKFIQSLDVLKQPRPSIKKIIKKTIIIPLLPSGYKKVIKYIDDPQQINNFISKKHPIPKYFLKPKANREELEKQQKKQQEKIQKKLEIKAKKQEEAAKRKEERKIEREKEKILREQEWKSICLEKYNSGAVLFNTGTNSNVRCSRCNMIGHVKSNKRLCPAYVEDQLEVKTEANVKNSEMNKEQKTKKTKKMKKNEKKKKVEQKPLQKVKSRRREINEFEQLLVKLIEREQDKEIIQKSGGLMELLNMSEKGYSWTVDEMEEALKKVYGEDFEYFQDEIEELKFRQEIKASAPLPKKIKSKPKVQMIEESETLIINTL